MLLARFNLESGVPEGVEPLVQSLLANILATRTASGRVRTPPPGLPSCKNPSSDAMMYPCPANVLPFRLLPAHGGGP